MALSGSCVVKATGQNNLIFSWGAVQDTAANQSVISWQILLEAGQFGRIDATPGSPWSATVAGKSFSGTTSLAIGNYETKVLASGQVTLPHDAHGAGGFDFSFTQEFWIQFGSEYITVVTGSGSAVLDPIARASVPTLSAEGLDMGSALTIYTNRADPALTHTLEYRFGSDSGTIARGVGDLYPWTPPIELARQIPNGEWATAVILCTTYAGETPLGTKEVAVVLSVPEHIVPTASAQWEDITGTFRRMGTLVQGISKLELTLSGAGSYGSRIISTAVTLGGKPYNGGTVTDAGALRMTVSVTDSRGRTGTTDYPLEAVPYAPPSLTLSASRCLPDGTPDDTGDHARLTVTGSVVQVAGQNTASLTVHWGTGSETLSCGAGSVQWEKVVPADPNATMPIAAQLMDALASTNRTMTLSTGYATLDLLAGGKGLSLGKAATREGFDCAMPAYFSGGLYGISVDGNVDDRSLLERVAVLEGKAQVLESMVMYGRYGIY